MIDPEALELIASCPESRDELVEGVIRGLERSTLVVGASEVRRCKRWLEFIGGDGQSTPPDPNRSASKRPQPAKFGEAKSSSPSMASGPAVSEGKSPYISVDGRVGISPPQGGRGSAGPVRLGDPELEGRIIPAWAGKFSQGSDPLARGRPDAGPPSPDGCEIPATPPQAALEPFCLEGLSDITGRSTCVGEYQDFIRYFRDRYSRIREILSGRLNARPIESLRRDVAGREISVIGMVMEVRTSAKGNRVVELEDPTGMVTVIFQKGAPGSEEVETLVSDEVIGVSGTTDGKGRFFGKTMVRPDLQSCSFIATGEGGASSPDAVHVGSTYFMEDARERFIECPGETDDPLGIASKVKMRRHRRPRRRDRSTPARRRISPAWTSREQYERAAERERDPRSDSDRRPPGTTIWSGRLSRSLLCSIPFGAYSRRTSPSSETRPPSGSAALDRLVYHGRSIDDLVLKIPGFPLRREPEKAMVRMPKRRHLSPSTATGSR